jgi:hypothetical protein
MSVDTDAAVLATAHLGVREAARQIEVDPSTVTRARRRLGITAEAPRTTVKRPAPAVPVQPSTTPRKRATSRRLDRRVVLGAIVITGIAAATLSAISTAWVAGRAFHGGERWAAPAAIEGAALALFLAEGAGWTVPKLGRAWAWALLVIAVACNGAHATHQRPVLLVAAVLAPLPVSLKVLADTWRQGAGR